MTTTGSVRVNHQIRAKSVRVIGKDGEQLGILPTDEGIALAEKDGLDLVEVASEVNPPVCRVMNYGKYLYGQEKKKREARKKQKTVTVKEVKMRPRIEEHDYQVKLRNARRFLEHRDKVKLTLMFRGREMFHQELGRKVLQRMISDLEDLAQMEKPAASEGRALIVHLAPRAVS